MAQEFEPLVPQMLNPITSESAFGAEHHFMAESYFLFAFQSVMVITWDTHAAI
jgi:hypothetical protein